MGAVSLINLSIIGGGAEWAERVAHCSAMAGLSGFRDLHGGLCDGP